MTIRSALQDRLVRGDDGRGVPLDAGVARSFDQMHSQRSDLCGELLALVGVACNSIGVGKGGGEIHLRSGTVEG